MVYLSEVSISKVRISAQVPANSGILFNPSALVRSSGQGESGLERHLKQQGVHTTDKAAQQQSPGIETLAIDLRKFTNLRMNSLECSSHRPSSNVVWEYSVSVVGAKFLLATGFLSE